MGNFTEADLAVLQARGHPRVRTQLASLARRTAPKARRSKKPEPKIGPLRLVISWRGIRLTNIVD